MTHSESAPVSLLLPMKIRSSGDAFGYTHGMVNHEGVKHPGDDLNNGPNAWADLGQDLVAQAIR